MLELFRKVMFSGSDVTEGVGTMIGEEVDVSDMF